MSLYPTFVEQDTNEIRAFVAYALHKKARRQWREEIVSSHGREPTAEEIAAYTRTWTPQLVQNTRDAADSALSEYAETVVDSVRPAIVEEALRGSAWGSIWFSIVANAVYTLGLIAIVILLKVMGVDLLSALQAVHG